MPLLQKFYDSAAHPFGTTRDSTELSVPTRGESLKFKSHSPRVLFLLSYILTLNRGGDRIHAFVSSGHISTFGRYLQHLALTFVSVIVFVVHLFGLFLLLLRNELILDIAFSHSSRKPTYIELSLSYHQCHNKNVPRMSVFMCFAVYYSMEIKMAN